MSHLFLTVSRTAAPLGLNSSDWYIFAFDATLEGGVPTARWLDFPGLGVTGDAIVVTAHMFPFNEAPSSTNQTIKIRIFDKAKLVAGASMTWTDIVGLTDPSDGMPLRNILQPGSIARIPDTSFL